jgi:hypothetical protein
VADVDDAQGVVPQVLARPSRRGRIKVVLVAAVVVLAVVTLGLMYWRGTGSTVSVSPIAPAAVLGSDGLPSQIDGQRVYRLADKAEWATLSGGFLLAAYPGFFFGSCVITGGSAATAAPTADKDLLAAGMSCYGAWLSETANSTTNSVTVAPKSPSLATMFMTWGGHAVVLTVHTHDPEAAGCSAARQAQCAAAVVVDSMVWPTVPTEVNGEHVYGSTELGNVEVAGTLKNLPAGFMLGGVVTVENPAVIAAPCADYGSEAEQQLLVTCRPQVAIGGEPIAPDSNFNAVDGQIVVVRVHVNDALAAQCPADVRTACEQAIVVDSVVWTSNPYSAVPISPSTVSPTMQIYTTP